MRFWPRSRPRAAIRPRRSVSPTLERLEDRLVPALVGEMQVNQFVLNDQNDPAVAVASNGRKVVVWVNEVDINGNDTNIHAQQYDANGDRLGDELMIASTEDREFAPSVAMDMNGNFIVTWTRDRLGSGDLDVHAAIFGAGSGSLVASGRVAGLTTQDESFSSVAADADGFFVVAYQAVEADGSRLPDVFARRFAPFGSASTLPFAVSAKKTRVETAPAVAVAPNGKFAITYNFDNTEVRLRRYNRKGGLLGSHTVGNADAASTPDVAIDGKGNCIVVWEVDNNVGGTPEADAFSRRITSTGALGGVVPMASGAAHQFDPTVAIDVTTGYFVVAVNQFDAATSTSSVLLTQRDKKAFRLNETASVVITQAGGSQIGGFDNDGYYFLAYSLANIPDRGDGNGDGVFATLGTIFGAPG